LAFFGRFPVVAATASGAASAIQAETPVYHALTAIGVATPFHKAWTARIGIMLTPVGNLFATLFAVASFFGMTVAWL